MEKVKFNKSEKLLQRALRSIPLGTQTFSKSRTQYPFGVSPFFASKALGSRLWDVDGNCYIDFVNSLAAVMLGYSDPDVTLAVRRQLREGVLFSLPHPVEVRVAEKIIEMVPCAEMVRFGKNGSDATSGAIRLARAYTKKNHVAVCGYHGWQDWYIGSTSKNIGVPECVRKLTHPFVYNDIESLNVIFRKHRGNMAAVIMEPMNTTAPQKGFLEEVKKLTHKHGAILIFDEMVTGFRYAKGGAQEYFHVTPDLATFGKSLANGYPLAVLAGSRRIMSLMEDVFFSFTFGGEALSLAAADATLNKIQGLPVIEHLFRQGEKVLAGVRFLLRKYGIEDFVSITGHPSWTFLIFRDTQGYSSWEIKTLFLQESFRRGILTLGTHNISYAHSDKDIAHLLKVYDEVFELLEEGVRCKQLHRLLRCNPLKPLFKVR